ncbi:MAG: hypothetical protein QMD76_04085 [Anaerosomatales bacterium]|nr:hypothetical protein [Anaerosomatales bacterium]
MRRDCKLRFVPTLALVVILAAGALLVDGCSCSVGGGARSGDPARTYDSPEEAVRGFYESKTKHGFATFTSGASSERVEFWFDQDGRYRLTWYYSEDKADEIKKHGPVRLHMVSPDGIKVYYCRPEAKACELAYTTAEKQQWTFNGPPDWSPEAGVQQGEYTVFTYQPEKLWDIEGASQQFYLYDMKVYTRGKQVEKIVMRTSSRKAPVDELIESQFTIDEFELDVSLPQDVFELPYEVKQSN